MACHTFLRNCNSHHSLSHCCECSTSGLAFLVICDTENDQPGRKMLQGISFIQRRMFTSLTDWRATISPEPHQWNHPQTNHSEPSTNAAELSGSSSFPSLSLLFSLTYFPAWPWHTPHQLEWICAQVLRIKLLTFFILLLMRAAVILKWMLNTYQ